MLVPSGAIGNHLFVIVLGPKVLPGYGPHPQVLLLSVTSIKPGIPIDPACLLDVGDHDFIKHPSYVYYRKPRIELASSVEQYVVGGQWPRRNPLSAGILDRVLVGIDTSGAAPGWLRALFK